MDIVRAERLASNKGSNDTIAPALRGDASGSGVGFPLVYVAEETNVRRSWKPRQSPQRFRCLGDARETRRALHINGRNSAMKRGNWNKSIKNHLKKNKKLHRKVLRRQIRSAGTRYRTAQPAM
ncbi:hypothetical protein NDU88_007719 [Pleurodeles waltl]|uniref:Uncharacterized protein n=1 Tax=Pleurodeles waltl TaxID=8319 RepID=A0AAV7STR4_PLEWA|nr:hypothetical protein NDU88_007719 [Pleurodeles waltl]